MADLAGAEDAPATRHDVVAGHPGRLVDHDDSGRGCVKTHNTIAVSANP